MPRFTPASPVAGGARDARAAHAGGGSARRNLGGAMTAQQSGPTGRHAQPGEPGLDSEIPPYGTDAAGAGSSGPGLYERETAVAWASAWQVLILVAVVT